MTQPWPTDWAMLYRNPKQKRFLVVAEAKRGFAKYEVGEPLAIDDSEFDSVIVNAISQFLDSFRSNAYDAKHARGGSPEENRQFIKNHLAISAERLGSGDLVLRPHHHKGSGYVALTGEEIVIPQDKISDRLAAAIREAFDLAS